MKFQIQILGVLAALPCILSAPAAAPKANVARAPEGTNHWTMCTKGRDWTSRNAPEDDNTLYAPLDYVYEGKRSNAERE